MKRMCVLALILVLGSLSLVVSAFQGQPSGPTPAALDATKIEKVKDNLFVITGADNFDAFSGGNTAVFITEAGVTLVDTKLPGWGQPVLDRVRTVTNKPVTRIINTHSHGDHTGSNEFFGTTVESIVHENAKTNMTKMDEFKGDKAKFLPNRTYKNRLTLGGGKDRIELYHFGPGHTSGDTFVVFPALRTMHTGDMFAWKALPFIDVDNGGSATGHARALAAVIANIKNVDTVITGHTPVLTWNDLREYANFSRDFVAWAQEQMKAGKTVAEAGAAYKVPDSYKGYTAGVGTFVSPGTNAKAVYDELRK